MYKLVDKNGKVYAKSKRVLDFVSILKSLGKRAVSLLGIRITEVR